MAYARYGRALTAIREVLDSSLGSLRTIPAARFDETLHEGVSEDELARRGVTATKPFRVEITEQSIHRASPPINGSLLLYRVGFSITVSRTISPDAQVDADTMSDLRALAWEDADAIRQALETPPNLHATADGLETDIAGSALRYVRTRARIVTDRPPMKAQRYETRHDFTGVLKSRSTILTDAQMNTTRMFHDPIVSASRSVLAPGAGPQPIVIGTLIGMEFTSNGQALHRFFKIPVNYVGDASFHLHWTKSTDADEEGRFARWRISYTIVNGIDEDLIATPDTIEIEQAYTNGTTSRTLIRSDDYALSGALAGYYVAAKIERIAAEGTALQGNQVLASVDLMYSGYINRAEA